MKNNKIFKTTDIILFTICLVLFAFLFYQNFLFSQNFDLLLFREVDDLAFQTSLHNIHNNILSFRPNKLFKLNDYGYGWIFWFANAVITFPLYLLSHFSEIDWPVIVMPRQLALLLAFGSLYFLYKITLLYTKNQLAKTLTILLFLTFPTFPFLATKFGTGAWVLFFCSFAFYLVAKLENPNKKDLRNIAIITAVASSIKLSGILIMPLICLFLADRFSWKFNKENIKNAGYFLGIFFVCLITFSNPSLLFSIFKTEYFTNYSQNMINYMKQTSVSNGEDFSFRNNFLFGIVNSTVGLVAFVSLTGLMIIKLFYDFKNNQSKKFDFLYITIFISLISIYLSFSIRSGSSYIASYFSAISFLLALSVVCVGISQNSNKIIIIILCGLFAVHFVNRSEVLLANNIFSYRHFYLKSINPTTIENIDLQKKMQDLVGMPIKYSNKLNIIQDFQAPTIYTNFNDNVATAYNFDNINVAQNNAEEFDYVLLSRESKAFLPEGEFNKLMTLTDKNIAKDNIESRKIVEKLISTKKFKGSNYKVILDNNRLILFQKV